MFYKFILPTAVIFVSIGIADMMVRVHNAMWATDKFTVIGVGVSLICLWFLIFFDVMDRIRDRVDAININK